MIEVEVKLPVADLEKIRTCLILRGFAEVGHEKEQDTYFDNAAQQIRTEGQALRVRETTDCTTGQVVAQINFKGKKMDQITMTRQELETSVGSGETCRQLLEAIGFQRMLPEVIKERTSLKSETMTACLDQVEGLGSFLELEVLVEEQSAVEDALKQIEKILTYLDYKITDTVHTSYLSMLQKKRKTRL